MNPQDIEKLLGGYATNTLTEDERNTLFTAALENQALFDALADEQALRELLDDPPSRAHLLAALREDRESLGSRFLAWLRRPSAMALAAAVAAGVVMIAVIPRKPAPEKPAAVAVNIEPQKQEPRQEVMQQPAESAREPKPDAPAPAGSPRRAMKEKAVEPERDFVPPAPKPAQPAPLPAPPVVASAPSAPLATAAAPPPPTPMMAPPARSQFRATENVVVRQEEQSKLSDAKTATAGGSVSGTSARGLYYASRSAAAGTLADKPAAGFGGNDRFGRTATLAKKRAAPAAEPTAAVIAGVRYSILMRRLDGSFAEVDPSTVFVRGDALRLRLETNQAGNLSVMERQADGTSSLRLSVRTQPGQAVSVPADGVIDVTAPGAFRFLVRFSRNPRTEARLDQVAATAGLVRETASNSVYVVNPVAAADPVVDFELAINAR